MSSLSLLLGRCQGPIGTSPVVFRNDLLRAEIYPDSDDTTSLGNGTDGVYDRVEYQYNIQGDLIEKKDQNGTVHTLEYDKLGRRTHDRVTTLGSGVDGAVRRISTAYDIRGLVLTLTSYDNATVGSGNVVNELSFEYDHVDRLVNLDRGDLNANKDAISGTPAREEDFGLDPTGNWTGYLQKTSGTTDLDQDRTQNKVNETTAITATTGTNWADPVYDATGNMTTAPKPSSLANSLTCTYDAWYRLVEVKQGQTVVAKYEYDGRNRRAKKHLDSQSPGNPDGIDAYAHYFYNGEWQILETRQTTTESAEPENLQPKHQYVWSPRYIDAVVLRDENTDQDSLCDDQRLYYLNDANFNVTALVDTGGDAAERYLYDAYGAMSVMDGDFGSRASSSYANSYTYTGREFDAETGLYHYRHRYYHAQMGAFVSRDPIGYKSGINLYQYVAGSPLMRTDPTGESWWWLWPPNWWNPPSGSPPITPPTPQPIPPPPGPNPHPGPQPPHVPPWLPPLIPGLDPAAGTLECIGEGPKISIVGTLRNNYLRCPTEENQKRLREAIEYFDALDTWCHQKAH